MKTGFLLTPALKSSQASTLLELLYDALLQGTSLQGTSAGVKKESDCVWSSASIYLLSVCRHYG